MKKLSPLLPGLLGAGLASAVLCWMNKNAPVPSLLALVSFEFMLVFLAAATLGLARLARHPAQAIPVFRLLLATMAIQLVLFAGQGISLGVASGATSFPLIHLASYALLSWVGLLVAYPLVRPRRSRTRPSTWGLLLTVMLVTAWALAFFFPVIPWILATDCQDKACLAWSTASFYREYLLVLLGLLALLVAVHLNRHGEAGKTC